MPNQKKKSFINLTFNKFHASTITNVCDLVLSICMYIVQACKHVLTVHAFGKKRKSDLFIWDIFNNHSDTRLCEKECLLLT